MVYTSANSAPLSRHPGDLCRIYNVGSHFINTTKVRKVRELGTKVTKKGESAKGVFFVL